MARLPARPRSHAVAGLALVLTVVFAGEAAGAAAVPQRVIAGTEDSPCRHGQRRVPDLGGEQRGVPERLPGLREAPRDERGVPAQRSRHPRVRGWDRSRSEPGVSQQIDGGSSDLYAINLDPRTLEAAGPPSTRLVGSGVPASRTRSTCSRATRERRRRCSCTTAAPRRSRSSSATTSRRSTPRRGR